MTYRWVALALFGTMAVIGFYHRIRAARAGDAIDRTEEGVPIMILLRVFGFGMWIGLIVYLINPAWMAWAQVELPPWLRWTGAGLVAAALPVFFLMFRSLGKNATDSVAIRAEHELVTTGPYRWVRHPMYSCALVIFLGFSVLTANWFLLVMGSLAMVMIMLRTPVEEAKLIEQFGDAYREYQQRTGRLFPKLRP